MAMNSNTIKKNPMIQATGGNYQNGGKNQTNQNRYLNALSKNGSSGMKSQVAAQGFLYNPQSSPNNPVRTAIAGLNQTTNPSQVSINPVGTPTVINQNNTTNNDNQTRYLQNLIATGTEGQKKWAQAQLNQMNGATSETDNQTRYLQNLIATGTEGQKKWAQAQLSQMNGTNSDPNDNQRRYLENLIATGNEGQKKWAQAELNKLNGTNNPSSNSSNQESYLRNLMLTGNPGQQKWAQNELNKLRGVSDIKLPENYDTMMSPQDLMDYVRSQDRYYMDGQRLALDQGNARYQQQIDQALTDEQIQKEAERMADLGFSDAILGVENQLNTLAAQYDNNYLNILRAYERGMNELSDISAQNRARNEASIAARGLTNSSILDQTRNEIDKAQMSAVSELSQQFTDNIYMLDNEITALTQNLLSQRNNLTRQQQADVVARIDALTRERDNEVERLKLLIDQNYEKYWHEQDGAIHRMNDMYMGLYGDFWDRNMRNKEFAEDKRRWNLDYELRKKAGSYGGGGGYRSARPSSGKTTSSSSNKTSSSTLPKVGNTISVGIPYSQTYIDKMNGKLPADKLKIPTPAENAAKQYQANTKKAPTEWVGKKYIDMLGNAYKK